MKISSRSRASLPWLAALLLLAVSARAGSVVRLYYDGISTTSSSVAVRTSVATLTNAPSFPNSPSFREQLDDFTALAGQPLRAGLQGKDNSGADYGSFIRGYLEAPETGPYLFNVASDDNSALFLSTDHAAENRRLIAFELESGAPLFGGARQEQRLSAPINLVRGQKYYFEVLHKQAGGGSYIQVGWQRPDGVQEIIPALHLAQYPVDPFLNTGSTEQPPILNDRGFNEGDVPAAVSAVEGDELLLQLDVIAAQPTTIEWTRDGEVIPGENLSFFRVPRVPASLNGAKIQARVSNALGTVTSTVTTVSITPDVTPPSILAVETAGNPNLLRITFSEPVELASATNLANYQIRPTGGAALPIQAATLLPGEQVVEFTGTFNFQVGITYQLSVQEVRDQAVVPNVLAPNPTTTPFLFSAPTGTTYTFNAGRPAGFRFFGSAEVIESGSHDGSGYLRLTDDDRNQNGAIVITERRDVDQIRVRFKTRIADGASTSGWDEPGDGFSLNVAADLPLGTLGGPENGFTPDVPGNRLSFSFDTHPDSLDDQPSITVLLNNQIVTNIFVGTNGVPLNGVPPISRFDGRWVDVDIDLRRNGLLTLRYDGITLLDELPTAFEIVNSAQIGLAARTRSWYQTHWFDDLNVNFGEGDIGDVALSPDSVLGGTFSEGSEIRLAALPTGAGPFQYQWFKNGLPLAGETSRFLRLAAVVGEGGNFSVKVSNAFSETTSEPQAVVIQPDTTPPALVSIRGVAGGVNQVLLTFDEPLDPGTASDLATYFSPLFRVNEADLSSDGHSLILRTTPQRVGIDYPLTITGLKDRSAQGNAATVTVNFVASLSYKDEVLADTPVRYYRFEETSGTIAFTETTSGDRINTNGVYQNLPILGVPSLVPSAVGEYAAHFQSINTNYVSVPNGGDINDYRGPWAKKSYEFWFRAHSTPTPAPDGANNTTIQATTTAGLWEEGGNQRSIAVYLWRDPTKLNPAEAELTFHAYCSTPDGPGAPFGLQQYPPVFVTHTITTNVTYHVIAVMDGRTDSLDGELRLYINGELASRSTNGVGQIYNHNGNVEIARGNSRSHLDISANYGAFDGILDEVSTYNAALSEERILAHYRAGTGESLSTESPPTLVEQVDPRGHPNQLTITFNQPVSAETATNLANYTLRSAGGTVLPLQSAVLLDDLVSVKLNGAFNFAQDAAYEVIVRDVADILVPDNVVVEVTLPFTFTTAGPVGIAAGSDLGHRQITENRDVQFSVTASGQPPFTYQWNYNGAPLPGETGAVLFFSAPLPAAGNYTVTLANEFSTITSPPAQLTVVPDTAAPHLIGAQGLAGSLNEVRLRFNEALDPATATALATYNIPGLTVVEALLSADGRQVVVKTSPQANGDQRQLTITGLRDLASTPNVLNTTAAFVSAVNYREEVLAEGAVRYWTFGETEGPDFHTLASQFDTTPESLVGTYGEGVIFGAPSLVPNLPDDPAVELRSDGPDSRIEIPNARDINAILGPWAKRTHLFSFRADKLPRVTVTNTTSPEGEILISTNVAAPALYAHDRIGIYLFGTQESDNPTEAILGFRAHNTTSEGPGTPWGGNTLDTSKHVLATIRAGEVYHVAAVLDGSAGSFDGQLRLYVNSELADAVGGIGQIYKHPNTWPSIGQGAFRTHAGVNQGRTTNARFDGVIDEFALIPRALSPARIAQLYAFALTPPPDGVGGGGDSEITEVRIEDGNLIITWEGSGQLQRADRLDGPFATLEGATSPFTEPVEAATQRFYQLAP